jgi:hypothetical protein
MANEAERAQEYQNLVLKYEDLDTKIDALLDRNDGASENMSAADRETYKTMARERSEIYNQIKAIEADWQAEDNNSTP